MSEFKFVCRQIELNEALSSLTNSELVLLHSQNNSGLTHFLKKLMQSLWNDSSVSFYIDGESNLSISNQRLTAYVAEHPDAYQKEIAEEFGCSAMAICLAMKRLKITRKKDNRVSGAGQEKSSGVSGGDPHLSHGKDRICG